MTPRMRECLHVITAHVLEFGEAPTVEDIRLALGLASKSGVQRMIVALVERGAIRRGPRARP